MSNPSCACYTQMPRPFRPSRLHLSLFSIAAASVFQLATALFVNPSHAAVGDIDDDGIADAVDIFPCEPAVASLTSVPAQNQFATLFFEDQWPNQGDYDFNDLVLGHNVEISRNTAGLVTRLRYTFAPQAMGALFDNGLAVHIPTAVSIGTSATLKIGSGAANAVALESGESEVVVRIADNIRNTFFGGTAGQVNTDDANATVVTPEKAELVINFASPVSLDVTKAPYDIFIFRSDDFSYQIHATGELGTDKMRQDLWGANDDNSKAGPTRPVNGKAGPTTIVRGRAGPAKLTGTFQDRNGVPFVLSVPVSTAFPKEGNRIDALFPDIVTFGQSAGAQAQNFFNTNINNNRAYGRPLAALPSSFAGAADRSCLASPLTPSSVTVMADTCPAGWTDVGSSPSTGQGSAACATGLCRLCRSPATESAIPASIAGAGAILMDQCLAPWVDRGAGLPSGQPAANCTNGVPCRRCSPPAEESAATPNSLTTIPVGSVVVASSCPAPWIDIGTPSVGQGSIVCGADVGAVSCRRCLVANAPAIPASVSVVSPVCPVGWTDGGEISAGPGAAGCGAGFCHLCTSPAIPSVLASGDSLLMDQCIAPIADQGPTSVAGPAAALCTAGTACRMCSAAQNNTVLPRGSTVVAAVCNAPWVDVGSVSGGPGSITCGAALCRRCQIQ